MDRKNKQRRLLIPRGGFETEENADAKVTPEVVDSKVVPADNFDGREVTLEKDESTPSASKTVLVATTKDRKGGPRIKYGEFMFLLNFSILIKVSGYKIQTGVQAVWSTHSP